jgi:hypothetical protein
MRRTIALATASCFSLISCGAIAAQYNYEDTFNYLYDQCLAKTEYCTAYISGVFDDMADTDTDRVGEVAELIQSLDKFAFTKYLNTVHTVMICIPTNTTYEAIIQSVINYGRDHPETWTYARLRPVQSAIRQTWPCR